MTTVLYVAAPGGLPAKYVLATLREMDLHVVSVYAVPPDAAEREITRNLFRPHGPVIELGSLDEAPALVPERLGTTTVDAVVALSEFAIVQATLLAFRLGVRAASVDSVLTIADKYAQRRKLAEAGIPTPRFALIESPADLKAA